MNHLFSRLFFIIFLALSLSSCSLPFLGGGKMAALNITSTPKAGVFLDGNHIGSTPYFDEKLKPGEYSLRMVPEGGIGTPWEARIKLLGGILTVVSRELGDSLERSSGYVLSLEPGNSKDKASILVVTTPDGGVISIDGEPRGFAPVAIDNVSPGDHTILVSSPGYIEKNLKAQLIAGYKLTASVQLSKSPSADAQVAKADSNSGNSKADASDQESLDSDLGEKNDTKASPSPSPKTSPKPSPTPSSKPTAKVGAGLKPPYVTILDTPTGWLNVRTSPSTSSEVVKKVNPGDSFKFLEADDNGWEKIELDDGETGWISSKYAKLYKN